ncbi:MAG: two-component regulator propeller domain-containing protein [Balneolaceae bacterium]|nr:two-component regulator propeller domain-containing protein [Balneolaceae bacterium]
MPFRNYSIEVGLSESVAHDLIQDERGYIWVATGYGLNRFDGNYFRQFYEDDGLANDKVNSLYLDSDNRVWVGTESGISVLEDDSLFTPPHLNGLDQFAILSIFEDNEGSFWFGTDGNGLWKLEANHELYSYSERLNIPVVSVRAIDQSADSTLWIASREGVFRIKRDEIIHYGEEDGLPELRVRDIVADDFGRVWAGSRSGLALYQNGGFQLFTRNDGLNDNRIQSITVESENRIWLGTESGVSLFNGENFENYTRENGLPATIIYDTMMDREGKIWFGTLGGGISIYSGDIFYSYTVDNGLPNNVVNGFEEDESGRIWAATFGGGIAVIDDGEITTFNEEDGLVDNKVYVIYRDSENRMWIGTSEGVSVYENGEFRTFELDDYPLRTIRKFFEDPETGDLWIATYDDGLFRIRDEGYERYHTGNVLTNNTVMDIKKGPDGNLWFATYGGAVRYDGDEFHYITIADNLPSNGVIHIQFDQNGQVWFATFNGPATLKEGQVERILQTERTESMFYYTEQDSFNRYWFGTNTGLYLFRKSEFDSYRTELDRALSLRLYTTKQGLIANELNAGASLIASDGSMWLGTVEGLSRFFPDRIQKNEVPPGLEFQEILMSGSPVLNDGTSEFKHDQNFLQATFIALTYEAPEQIIYEYRLRGYNDWQITKENTINYPALPSGDYRLEVRAYNADGTRSTRTASFAFKIFPPFYLQTWFLLLVIAAILGLILFSIRYFRVTKQVDMEKMRVQIASDLHDDVGSSLTELALQTDFLQAVELNPDVKDTLKQIGEHSRKIVSSLDDIVWSIDSRNDTAGDLTDRMQDYVNHIFVNGHAEVFYHFEDLQMDQKLPVDVKENVYLIFKESVNNVIKHSNATRVDIHFSFNGKNYELVIRDNGTNGKDSNRKSGQGLRNMKMRAERIDADISIEPEDGFTVELKGSA